MFRVWYSTESFADYIIENTDLKNYSIVKSKLYESDASNAKNFHRMPDHIRKIMYLDSPDLIVERETDPIFSIEVSTEAGTGHNVLQRFARIAASVENDVPAFYIYPKAVIVTRKNSNPRWDSLNPIIFRALDSMMSIFNIPALFFYFPSDYDQYINNASGSPNIRDKGLIFEQPKFKYPGSPSSTSNEMQKLFECINELINEVEAHGVMDGRKNLLKKVTFRDRRAFMQNEYSMLSGERLIEDMSPLTSTKLIPTQVLLNYLSKYETNGYSIGELLSSREYTIIYQVNAKFRGDPYPGALAGIDYLATREGKTYEDRKHNLVLVFGSIEINSTGNLPTLEFTDKTHKEITISAYTDDVKASEKHNLLTRDYSQLTNEQVPRYYMQSRYGSTYSKVKHIRVYSYFADAILFPDGSLWRDA